MAFYNTLGFRNHPFAHTNADDEPFLADYFVPPPFFHSVIGDPDFPNSCVVFAPRGGGKSAQRRMIESWAIENNILAVTYDRFEFGTIKSLENINLAYHMRNIIIRTLVSYLSFLADYHFLLEKLDKKDKKIISIFVHTYLGDMTGYNFQVILDELKSLPQRFRDYWNNNIGIFDLVVKLLSKRYGLEHIHFSEIKQEEHKLTGSYKNQLEILLKVIREIGFKSIYILIDKVDETEKTSNDPERSYELIRPLIRDLELLSLKGFGFKFFLWDKIEPFFRNDARPDRIGQYHLSWNRQFIKNVLQMRLKAFSKNRIYSFRNLLIEDPGYEIDSALALLANGSPRNLIRLCEKIFSIHAEFLPSSKFIELNEVEKGILLYCKQITDELYETEIIKGIKRIGRELFTMKFVVKAFGTSEYGAIKLIEKWLKIGIIKEVGAVVTFDEWNDSKYLKFYYIIDPAMIRLIHASLPFKILIKDRWIPCPHCEVDNFMDISLIPPANEPLCFQCNQPLFR